MKTPKETPPGTWIRPQLARTGPNRRAGGLYRTEDLTDPPAPGVPLNGSNAAVVAAVRLAYQVADAQIQRSTRLARRLRGAGDKQVGRNSDRRAVDGAERLLVNALLSGLEWWEGSVVEGRCPVKRLAAAEYQMLGSLLGFTQPLQPGAAPAHPPGAPGAPPPGLSRGASKAAAQRRLDVVFQGEKQHRRRIRVESWELASTADLDLDVFFHPADGGPAEPLVARLLVAADGKVALRVTARPNVSAGRWTCAVWNRNDVQVGHVEIVI